MSEVRVAALSHADLPDVVAIHIDAFPDSAITKLGRETIARYYAWLMDGPHDAKLMGAWTDTQLVGFCAAGVFRGALNGFLRANRRFLALHLARHPRLLLSPLVRDRLWLAVGVTFRFSRLRRSPTVVPSQQRPSFGVLSIATKPRVHGSGAGRALMREAETRARARGFTVMNLTVHPDNARAVRFYEQLGWTRRDENGAWSGSMQRVL
jgi:ribosomal protein S18 acetylase RimI-like enzyme